MDEEEAIKKLLEQIQKDNNGDFVDYAIPGYAEKKVVGYFSIREDLILCKDILNEINGNEYNKTIVSGLFYSFIAIYGKCFTDASSSNHLS